MTVRTFRGDVAEACLAGARDGAADAPAEGGTGGQIELAWAGGVATVVGGGTGAAAGMPWPVGIPACAEFGTPD